MTAIGQTETFSTGSFIINMGATTPNTIANGLKPYGLMYDLIRNYNVPIKWVINQTKVKDGIDFTYNGVAYKGGTFLINAEYRSAVVNARIAYWTGQGVVGTTTTGPLTLDVAVSIVSFPKWTLDATNGVIAEGFLINAGITNAAFPGAYNWKSPAALDCCDDYFVMPHADPTWATHGRLWAWNKDCLGSVWAGCHAVSVLESLVNPSNATQKMNFLSTTGLLLFGSHSGGSVPYTHQLPGDPVAQYLGPTDLAQLNGSEQIYMPNAGGAWRPTTQIVAYDPTQANVPGNSPGPASVIVYGRGMGDPTRGYVMYEASHSINKGTVNDVAAQRAFFNFSFFQTTPKAPYLTITNISSGQQVAGGATITGMNVVATSPLAGITFTYQWTSSCGGSFTNPTGTTTNYTAPVVGVATNCVITCKVTDNCGRASFKSFPIIILPPPAPPVANPDSKTLGNGCLLSTTTVNIDVLANDTDPNGLRLTFDSIFIASANPLNAGTWSASPSGIVSFTPAANFTGAASIPYRIHNSQGGTATSTVTVNIGTVDAKGCFPNQVWGIAIGDFVTTDSITNVGNPGNITGELSTDLSLDNQEGIFSIAGTDFIDMGTNTGNLIDLHLPVTLNIGDTVQIDWGKRTNAGTTVISLKQSATTTFAGAATTQTITGTGNLPTATRYPIITNGINYIRIQVGAGTTQQLYIDAVESELWSCVSRAPNTGDDNFVVLEDNPTNLDVMANDIDPATNDNSTLTVSGIVTQPAMGKVSINPDNTITYVSIGAIGANTTDVFTYSVSNSQGYSGTATVTVNIQDDGCASDISNYKPVPLGAPSTLTVNPTNDSHIEQNHNNNNYGAVAIVVGNKPTSVKRGLLKFDLSTIPAGSIISSAILTMTTSASSGYTANISIYKVTTAWLEGTVKWKATAPWTIAGGDFNATIQASASVPTGSPVVANWSLSGLVQDWVNTPAGNQGMILRSAEGTGKQHTFYSKETGGVTTKPKLVVTYQTPLPCQSIPNRAPLAMPDTASTNSVTMVSVPVIANDGDAENNALSLHSIISATNGSAIISGNNIQFTPTVGYNGKAKVLYRVSDGTSKDSAYLYITVGNAPPVAVNDLPPSALSGLAQSYNVGANDSDPEGASPLVYSIYQDGKNGSSSISVSTITYTPNAGFTGKDTVYYQVSEPVSGCSDGAKDSAYVVFTVLNRQPTATNDNKNVLPCLSTTFNLIGNDTDPENGVLMVNFVSPLSNPAAGTLINNNDGTVTFTPATGFLGTVTFTYTVADNGVPSLTSGGTTTVTIVVSNPVNTAPVAGNDAETAPMDQVIYSSVLDNDSDPENQNLTNPVITVAPAHGSAIVLANGLIQYTPNPGFFGTDVLTYQICDMVINPATCSQAPALCTTATLSITVTVPNTVVAINDENSTWINVPVSGGVMDNDRDPEGDTKMFTGFISGGSSVNSGSITVSGVDVSGSPVANAGTLTINVNGTYTYTPFNNFTGIVTVPYTITDNNINTAFDTAYLKITVSPLPANSNSVIANNDENISYGAPVNGNVLVNDRDPEANAFTVTAFVYDSNGDGTPDGTGVVGTPVTIGGTTTTGRPTSNAGALTLNANGAYTFTPAADFHGSVDVPYTICDNGTPVACATAILHIDVLPNINGPANDPPIAGDDFGYTTINQPVTGSFVNNDSDPNTDPISVNGVTINTGGAHTPIGAPVATAMGGTVQFYADGTYTYTPPVGYVGPDKVNYTTCDVTVVAPQPLCADAQIHLLVGPGINILGRVWDDANGNIAINGAEAGTNAAATLYVNLVNAGGNVVAVAAVLADGSYSFLNVTPGANYSLVLSTVSGIVGNPAPAAALPSNWVNTGESRNGTIDGGTLGVIDQRAYGFSNTINFDFGIEQLPNSTPVIYNIPQPVLGQFITLNGGANPPVPSGTDAEDGALGASNTIVITTLPGNTTLWYNGIAATAGQVIPNFNPSLLQVQITAATLGSVSTTFQFAYRDAAGKQDPTPASYTLQWAIPLPIILASFTGRSNNCDAILLWRTAQELNVDRFEIEQSSDGVNFTKATELKAANAANGKIYQLSVAQSNAIMYYRLKIVDKDGQANYSPVVNIRTNCNGRDYMGVYPNPVRSALTLSFHTAFRGTGYIIIQNAIGQEMGMKKINISAAVNAVNVEMGGYAPGLYMLYVVGEDTDHGVKGERIGEVMRVVKSGL